MAGQGTWKITNTKSASLLAPARNARSKSIDANYAVLQPVIKAGTSYCRTDPRTLEITSRFVEESLGAQATECRFSELNGSISVSLGPKSADPAMGPAGRMQPAVQMRGVLVNPE